MVAAAALRKIAGLGRRAGGFAGYGTLGGTAVGAGVGLYNSDPGSRLSSMGIGALVGAGVGGVAGFGAAKGLGAIGRAARYGMAGSAAKQRFQRIATGGFRPGSRSFTSRELGRLRRGTALSSNKPVSKFSAALSNAKRRIANWFNPRAPMANNFDYAPRFTRVAPPGR